MEPIWPKVLWTDYQFVLHPLLDRGTRAVGNLEAHRFLCLALQDRCPLFDLTRRHHIDDFHLHQVTTAKLAVDRNVEQLEVALVLGQFKSHPDRPNMLRFQRSLLTDDASLVPSWAKCANGR